MPLMRMPSRLLLAITAPERLALVIFMLLRLMSLNSAAARLASENCAAVMLTSEKLDPVRSESEAIMRSRQFLSSMRPPPAGFDQVAGGPCQARRIGTGSGSTQ